MNKLVYVDVGARGGIKQFWRLQKDLLDVHAFEPNKDEWEPLKKWIWWEEANLYPYALWRFPATLDLYVTKDPGLTSVYKPRQLHERMEVVRTDQVEARTLDSFELKPDFIKVDVQGAELDVLRGAEKSIEECTGVEAEVSYQQGYEGQPLFDDITHFMNSRGFSLWRTTATRMLFDGVWFTDAIYLKDGTEGTKKRAMIEAAYPKGD